MKMTFGMKPCLFYPMIFVIVQVSHQTDCIFVQGWIPLFTISVVLPLMWSVHFDWGCSMVNLSVEFCLLLVNVCEKERKCQFIVHFLMAFFSNEKNVFEWMIYWCLVGTRDATRGCWQCHVDPQVKPHNVYMMLISNINLISRFLTTLVR